LFHGQIVSPRVKYRPPVTSITSSLFGQIVAIYEGPRRLQLTGQLEF